MLDRDLRTLAQAATVMMGLVATGFLLSVTREILAPMVLALAVAVVLSPISDFWERLGFSSVLGALTSLVVALVMLGCLVMVFQPVVMQLIDVLPGVWSAAQDMMTWLRRSLQTVADNGSALRADTSMPLPPAPAPPAEVASETLDEALSMPDVGAALWYAPAFLGQVLIFAGTLFFFLLSRRTIYEFVARRLSRPANRSITAQRLRAAERQVSRYFLTVTAINAALGLATAATLHAVGLPGAGMWGLLAFVLNFVVYLGPAVMAVVLTVAATASFDGAMVLAPAALFVAINTLEGQFVTPALVGRNLAIEPFVVFVAIVFGIWLWGPIGGIVAIPLLLWTRVLVAGEAPATHGPPCRCRTCRIGLGPHGASVPGKSRCGTEYPAGRAVLSLRNSIATAR
ncbi:MAG TPA: AI-2E family transporter [Paracoccaceae bacterium]|nr:AI-2E family transporter [Paracoccaceae bacterium]